VLDATTQIFSRLRKQFYERQPSQQMTFRTHGKGNEYFHIARRSHRIVPRHVGSLATMLRD
jgi:hypothetical protein